MKFITTSYSLEEYEALKRFEDHMASFIREVNERLGEKIDRLELKINAGIAKMRFDMHRLEHSIK
ncbi:hypothetical protein UFOVP1596_28 [uncultured Caudovirales phage]|uniref:Uncharacterized protein n=1 Tax=uncultured Caudovirales phage TaxID=2100421 RepID=A0A6J5SU11_9CAUD|nr:hypothetical protein UFOVP1596_28 [uncultured Caudovirales phage]